VKLPGDSKDIRAVWYRQGDDGTCPFGHNLHLSDMITILLSVAKYNGHPAHIELALIQRKYANYSRFQMLTFCHPQMINHHSSHGHSIPSRGNIKRKSRISLKMVTNGDLVQCMHPHNRSPSLKLKIWCV